MATSVSVIVTTFEWPDALDAVLRGLATQSDASFDVVVADDGSGPETAAVVDGWRETFPGRLTHAWQPDEGFRLSRARNLGAVASDGSYLVFVDGDCIPRPHFVAAIRRAAVPGWFLAGKRVQLSREFSDGSAPGSHARRGLVDGDARSKGTSRGRPLEEPDAPGSPPPVAAAATRLRAVRERVRLSHGDAAVGLRARERLRPAVRGLG